jgi:diguanylate cyclase (GGDEF)-like protein
MKGKKRSKLFLIPIFVLISIVSITLYALFNSSDSNGEVKLDLFEQRWMENNKNNVIDVLIPNGVPLYTTEGKGIIFSFLQYFEDQTELELNKIAYTLGENNESNANRFRILNSGEKLGENDLLFYSDNYVVVSRKSQKKVPLDSMEANIGVLDADFNAVSSYLEGDKLTLTKVSDIDKLISIFNSDEVSYIIIPKTMYLDMIIESNYYIVNTLNDLSLNYVLTLSKDNDRLNDIIKKYYTAWTNNYLAINYNSELFSLYTNIKNIDDKSKTDFKSKRYVYGYVDNLPYEINLNGNLGGLSSEFINSFTSFSGVEFNFRHFKSVAELNKELESGKVDIALNYYNLNTGNTFKTLDLLYSEYVILANDNAPVIDTIKSLPEENLYTLEDTKLANYVKKNGRFNVKTVDEVSLLEGRDLILIDYNTYKYYYNNYFKDYTIAYRNVTSDNYGYVINKSLENELFYDIFNYYLSTLNHEQYKNVGMTKILTKTINFDLSLLWLYAILLPVFIGILILLFGKRKKIIKVRNDVKLKYIDPLTSLKNRYYLNNNIVKWEENKIYPQSILVININNLKDINDAYGHEGGDQLIKTAANILINNQMEKTDIVRTDGNEFIIYMVGYDESAVIAYVRKLYRLLKDLPYEYGASLGYSMIEDDIKTIEDAINEAILDMVTNRETKKNNEV